MLRESWTSSWWKIEFESPKSFLSDSRLHLLHAHCFWLLGQWWFLVGRADGQWRSWSPLLAPGTTAHKSEITGCLVFLPISTCFSGRRIKTYSQSQAYEKSKRYSLQDSTRILKMHNISIVCRWHASLQWLYFSRKSQNLQRGCKIYSFKKLYTIHSLLALCKKARKMRCCFVFTERFQ